MKPAADTHPRTCAPAPPGYASVFPGRADQVRQVRREIAAYLTDCPAADDIVFIADELAANASAPRGALSYPRCSREELEGGSWV